MIQEKEILIFLVLLFGVVSVFVGWFARIAWVQYKADCEREEAAEQRRREFENIRCEEYREQIKQFNRSKLISTWAEEAKGGAKK